MRKAILAENKVTKIKKKKFPSVKELKLKEKVQQLKSSFSVEGAPLIKSDRFTQEEYDEMSLMKNRDGTHPSHFDHLKAGKKVYSDNEIGDQISILLYQKVIPNLNEFMSKLFGKLKFENLEEEKSKFSELIYAVTGRDKLPEVDTEFWRNFGSAPYSTSHYKPGDKLHILMLNYGHRGMDIIFDGKFDNGGFELIYGITNFLHSFDNNWNEHHKLKKDSEKIYMSFYKNLDDLEDNVVVKKMKIEARNFYMDKTKNFEDRIAVFNKHGEKAPYIHEATNLTLRNMFILYHEQDYLNRHSIIECISVIKFWLENISGTHRCFIDYSKNKFHPSIRCEARNYIPSAEAIERLKKYYIEKLMLEGVSSYELDW